MLYAIQAQVVWTNKKGWKTSRQIPTFFLDSDIQGIVNAEHAEEIAVKMLEYTKEFKAHVVVIPEP